MSLYQLEIARYVFHRHKRDNKSANDVFPHHLLVCLKSKFHKCMVSSSFKINTDADLSIIRDVASEL
jgi:hypothetical protein